MTTLFPLLLTTLFTGTVPNLKEQDPAPSRDEAAIADNITTLFAAADRQDWTAVRSGMADTVLYDYSALGGPNAELTPREITDAWASVLPGFSGYAHQPHNYAIWVAGDRATATYDAIAVHYLHDRDGSENGEDYWSIFAGYDAEFVRENGTWKMDRLRISPYRHGGNTKLAPRAAANVAAGRIPARETAPVATATVRKFFADLEAADLAAFVNNFAPDGRQVMDFSPNNFPGLLSGHAAIRKQYTAVVDFESQSYDYEIIPTANPGVVLVRYDGSIRVTPDRPYDNSYVGLFTVDADGKIERFVEEFNPDILLSGFPGLEPTTYSVHPAGANRATSGVTLQDVRFESHEDVLRGHLFLPPNFDEGATYPTVIVTGSWTSVKEQMPDEYASLLAADGFVTLTFDFRGFGESAGEPRQFEDHTRKIEDIRAAVDYLSDHPNVDRASLAGLGVCASAGYMAHATARDARIKNLTLIAPWLHDRGITTPIYDTRPGGFDGLLAASRAAKARYEKTGEVTYTLGASELDPLAAMYVPGGAFSYYLSPAKAAGAVYDNRFAVMSWEPWLTFNGIGAGKEIEVPVFIVHSEQGAVPQGTKTFYEDLGGEKDIVWMNEYTQEDLYHRPEAVQAALGRVSDYLKSATR